jgi:uncharacterized protein (DUF486 family)
MKTTLLLICSNIFMTIAWYGHLKYRKAPLLTVIVVSWLIAFAEYCFQVPANRFGYGQFTAFQLKIIQEVITLCVFVVFAWSYLGEGIKMESCCLVPVSGRRCGVRLLGKTVATTRVGLRRSLAM